MALSRLQVLATNRGITRIRGTDYKGPHGGCACMLMGCLGECGHGLFLSPCTGMPIDLLDIESSSCKGVYWR